MRILRGLLFLEAAASLVGLAHTRGPKYAPLSIRDEFDSLRPALGGTLFLVGDSTMRYQYERLCLAMDGSRTPLGDLWCRQLGTGMDSHGSGMVRYAWATMGVALSLSRFCGS